MTQMEMKEKIDALAKDDEFIARVKTCETAEAVAALYGEEGIEVDAEELKAALEAMKNSKQGDELTEDSLENVTGGFISGAAFLAWSIMYSVTVIGAAWTLGRMK